MGPLSEQLACHGGGLCRPHHQVSQHIYWRPTQLCRCREPGVHDVVDALVLLSTPPHPPTQVSALAWNPHDRELVSSHGYSKFDIKVWRYPTMTQIGQLTGHTQRILHMALSPDGTTVCSAAADESLRFFRCFAAPAAAPGKVWGGIATCGGTIYLGYHNLSLYHTQAKVSEGISTSRVRSIR